MTCLLATAALLLTLNPALAGVGGHAPPLRAAVWINGDVAPHAATTTAFRLVA